jgi:hypothetical protein
VVVEPLGKMLLPRTGRLHIRMRLRVRLRLHGVRRR